MPARKATPIRPVERVQNVTVKDAKTQQAVDAVAVAVQTLQKRRSRDVVTFNLVDGINKIPHGLGRAVEGYIIVPTELDATFASALDRSNPRPDLEVWIDITGGPQAEAVIEVF